MKHKLHFILITAFITTNGFSQTFNETFDTDITDGVATASFTRILAGESFTFSFTANGDGGDLIWLDQGYGDAGSPAINAQSFDYNESNTERITITKTNLSDFSFNSIFINNGAGTTITVAGYNDGVMVGSSQTVATGVISTLTFNNSIVDEVRLTATDFYQVDIDSFSGSTSTLSTEDVLQNSEIQLYPNPASDTFSISGLKSSNNYLIMNSLGENILSGEINPNEHINIQNLATGLYFVQLNNRNVLKLIKN